MTNHDQVIDPDILLPFTEAELIVLDCGIGNHEAELLTAGILALAPDVQFNKTRIRNEWIDRQVQRSDHGTGQSVKQYIELSGGWLPHESIPEKYCGNSLEPIGMVARGVVKGRAGPMPAWQATELGVRSLAYIGALGWWSLINAGVSLQQINGGSQSNSSVRSPEVRQSIYTVMSNQPNKALTYEAITNRINIAHIPQTLIRSVASDLADFGILSIVSKLDADYNPTFKIVDPIYHHVGIKFADLKPATQVMYKAQQVLREQGDTWTLQDLIQTAYSIDSTVSTREIRRQFTQGISERTTNLPGIKLGEGEMPPDEQAEVSLTPAYAAPISDLMVARASLKSPDGVSAQRQQGIDILNDRDFFRELMGKAKRFSPAYIAQVEKREGTEHRVIEALRELGQTEIKELRQRVEENGRRLTRGAVQDIVLQLVEQGIVDDIEVAAGSKKTTAKTYALKQSQGNSEGQ